MRKILSTIIVISASFSTSVTAQTNDLKTKIEHVIQSKKADVGVAITELETGKSVNVNGSKHYPMQSVFKFHIALAVLNKVDKGNLSLDQKIPIKPSDLLPDTWSPIRDAYPKGNVSLTLAEILTYTVSQSDNIGCDILLRLIGGPKVVNDYIHSIGIKDLAIQVNENDMHRDDMAQFKNWTTPLASNELLKKFYTKKILAANTYSFLYKVMKETSTGTKRLKGQLPNGTEVLHKTGSSGTNKKGITAATNDIGIVTLPNGHHYIITVFVANSKENEATNEKIIADISKLAWDYFNH